MFEGERMSRNAGPREKEKKKIKQNEAGTHSLATLGLARPAIRWSWSGRHLVGPAYAPSPLDISK